MDFHLLHPSDQLVMIMDRIYEYGMTTTSGGNLSILDDNGDIWITPTGIDKGSLTRSDMVRVKPDGTMEGKHRPSVELPFHQLIYKSRPDIKAIVHAHPPALVAFSILRRIPDVRIMPDVSQVCGEVRMAPYGLPGSADLGNKIAAVFMEGASTVMLENHGIVVGGSNLFRAFMSFETLDFCARIEMRARAISTPVPLTDKQLSLASNRPQVHMDQFIPETYSSEERAYRRDMCNMIHRAYDQRLFTSTQGTFSQRLSDDSFIVTPYMIDRKYMEERDLVRIKGDLREAGKVPSRSVAIHRYIYELHPFINSVIIAHPPNTMAFAVTNEPFDSRTIPESYIMLREVKKAPFGISLTDPKATAQMISEKSPVLIVENDCAIVTGSSLLNAFDRLEVLEYSAESIIESSRLGEIVMIGENEIKEINEAFKL